MSASLVLFPIRRVTSLSAPDKPDLAWTIRILRYVGENDGWSTTSTRDLAGSGLADSDSIIDLTDNSQNRFPRLGGERQRCLSRRGYLSSAPAVADGWAVGVSFTPGNDIGRLFAYSTCPDHPANTALATVDYSDPSEGQSVPLLVSGGWVIGGPTMSRGGAYSENDTWAYRLGVTLRGCGAGSPASSAGPRPRTRPIGSEWP